MAESSAIPPPGNLPHIPPSAHQLPPEDVKYKESALTPFEKFLGPTATKDQVKRFVNTWVNDMIHEIKRMEKKWKERQQKMRRGEY